MGYGMKGITKYLIFVLFFVITQSLYGQGEPDKIEPPEAPAFDFNFDFQNFPKMSKEDEKKLLKNLKEELRRELKEIKVVNENKYFEFLRESQYKNMRIPFFAKREKAMQERERIIFEAEVKTEALAAKYEKAKSSEKNKIKSQLRDELKKLFEQKENRRKSEAESLQNELIELKKSLEARQKNKSQIIERRLQELLSEDEYLDWE